MPRAPSASPTSGSSPLTRGKHSGLMVRMRTAGLIPAHAGKTMWPGLSPREGGAHPRSRGENRAGGKPQLSARGSSPLTRGKLDELGFVAAHAGLIPAHAGKTRRRGQPAGLVRAHPRSRGENRTLSTRPVGEVGSSPLTRGKRRECWELNQLDRLIPAHAGKTLLGALIGPVGGAHPRSRGENCRRRS